MLNRKFTWIPLDNAAKIFPAVTSDEHTTVFRLSVILFNAVNYTWLQNAILRIEEKYPYFKVCLRNGFFWYYLEHVNRPVVPVVDDKGLCRAFHRSVKDNPILFRVLAVRNRISVEFSHVITDGTGGKQFFSDLLSAYFSEGGDSGIPTDSGMDESIDIHKYEDAYNRYFKSEIPPAIKYSKAFHLPFQLKKKPRFSVLIFTLSVDELKQKAAELEVSVTTYLVSTYLFIIQEIQNELPTFRRRNKTLRIQVPVNLRKIYETKTLRNFSLFVLPEIDLRLGKYAFEEINKIVHYKMKIETDRKLINKIISRNVGSEKNIVVRGIPLIIKDLILHFKYYTQGADQYSGVITNLGETELPDSLRGRIRDMVFIPPPPNKKLKINCGVIGYNDHLTISFGNISTSTLLEQKFIRFLTAQGLSVKLMSY